MKTLFVLALLIISIDLAFSQTDSLFDVFPLAVGNQWMYRYSRFRSDVCGVNYGIHSEDRKSTRLNSSHRL